MALSSSHLFPSARLVRQARRLAPLLVGLVVLGCRDSRAGSGPGSGTSAPGVLGGERPALVVAPRGDRGAARPLVIALHGYGDTGSNFVSYLGYRALAAKEGFVLLAPDGSVDRRGNRYWNASRACCNFFGGTVDDVAYLRRLIADARRRYRVDRRRVYLIGLSNGGFMAYRFACEAADEVAAVISIAGAAELDPKRCKPTSRVSVLQVHGDADRIVAYRGGADVLGLGGGAYPGAAGTVERWAAHDGCSSQLRRDPIALDLDGSIAGAETVVDRAASCPAGIDVVLWTVTGAPHVPSFSPSFAVESWAFLRSHPKVAR